MNYKIALSAAFVAAVGLMGCDSRYDNDQANDRINDRISDVTSDVNSGTTTAAAPADLNTGQHNRLGSGNEEMADIRETNEARDARMRDRKVAPTYDENVYHSEDNLGDDDAAEEDDAALSGSTSEPMDDTKVSYSQSDLPGGMAKEHNLRYGLIGNGTGMGLEDTTSKFMTDNYTLSDPTISSHAQVNSGALSAPTEDQDALKDIKSGTSFEPENYYIEEED